MLEKYTAKNGLRIVAEKMPHVRSVSFGIWVNVGSRYETPEENGLTHFIEHMLFKGTKTRSAKQIAEDFDRIGAQTNAFTSKDQTCYYVVAMDQQIEEAVTILADMFFHSVFDPEEMEKEKQVIAEEMAMTEDAPDDDVDERLWAAMFEGHPLGAPILGTEATLQSFTQQQVKNFIRTHYTPDQVVLSVAGNFDDALISKLHTLFNQFENEESRGVITFDQPIFHAVETTKKSQVEQAHVVIGFPGLAVTDEQTIPYLVMNNIFGDSMSSRLFQKVREEKALAYTVYSYYAAYQDTGAFMIYGGTSVKQRELMEKTIFEVIEEFKQTGITEEELISAKRQLESDLLLGLETSYDYMTRNAKNEIIYGREHTIEEALELLSHVTVEQVNEQIAATFNQPHAKSIISSEF
ncbi:M16 family metallopeptidase [Kurthia gibsonii]|uniref:M16 family metallopeptidase n=1 Tax=Kurthia gibsonii TaxID=33946 RepID=UPI0031B734D2